MSDEPKWSHRNKKKSSEEPTEVPKTNYNPKSRGNLAQYSGKLPKAKVEKEKLINSLTEDLDVDPEMLEVIIPTKKIFTNDEQSRFLQLLRFHLMELSEQGGDITISDIQTVATLCKNIIMEDRLYEDAKKKFADDPTAIANVMASIDKLKKENSKLSESLATNRNVRVDPKKAGNTTILDIIEEYERKGVDEFQKRLDALKQEEDTDIPKDSYRTRVEEQL